MRLAVRPDGSVGLRTAQSHRVIRLHTCMVAHPALADLLPSLHVRRADELTIRVGAASGERTALASSTAAVLRGLPADVGVGPDRFVHERVGDSMLRVSASSFFQSGPQAAELLSAVVREECGELAPGARVLDAYGGIGLFSATLGLERPVVVESSPSACADAVVNLAGRDAVVECTPMEDWSPTPMDVAIADPSRAGLGRVGVDRVAATAAQRIVLVSCDPVSLARDARLLAEHGYVHVRSRVLDLFPNTAHVEVITRFARGGSDDAHYGDPDG
jgi:23S rRNA (uracil1939-C5)-methyltransferase